MLNILAVIAMVLIAVYLWRSSELLHCLSHRSLVDDDVTSAGASLLLRAICITMLILSVMFVATSHQPAADTSPESLDGMETSESHGGAAESMPSAE
ncbi:hypothetical protein KEM63_10175 [Halopseudomonas nanhaiensis]|uniref:hypothetical protein n=1 Tax=Halopseudomonas nanhaiensis TaxID=2830842 RepID=UPI001CBC0FB0|nr:hypothetical protein [Halopseudomonas nanhaiensis]UAW97197.1 hypothetical protein KEM63_10175 [Halopseudomonas nanhaiensis]